MEMSSAGEGFVGVINKEYLDAYSRTRISRREVRRAKYFLCILLRNAFSSLLTLYDVRHRLDGLFLVTESRHEQKLREEKKLFP